MAISKEQVWAAADELDANGQKPTLAAVRKAIGGVGSFTTISEMMAEWRQAKASKMPPFREPTPQALVEKLTELGGDVWSIALEVANGRFASDRDAMEIERQDMDVARQEVSELADQLTIELDEAKSLLESTRNNESSIREEVGLLRIELSSMKERAAIAEARAEELRKATEQAERRESDLRSELDRERAQAAEKVTLMAEQIEQLTRSLAAAQVTANQAENLSSDLRSELDREREQAAAKVTLMSDQIEQLTRSLATAEATAKQSERRASDLRSELDRAHTEADKMNKALVSAATEIEAEKSAHRELSDKLDKASIETRAAREEAATLRGRVESLEFVVRKDFVPDPSAKA